jgi:dihydrofolate reductase
MRRLVESTFTTLDGVISTPQHWSGPYWDDQHSEYASKLLFAAEALVLGRETYDGFVQAWPQRSGDDYTDRINAMPKHVASRRLKDPTWNASVIEGDGVEGVARLKETDGGDLLKFGTGDFSRQLIENGLIDELHLWVFPVVAGKGDRLLEGLATTHLQLADVNRMLSGIVVHVCTPK